VFLLECSKCGKKNAKVLVPIYVRDNPKEFFAKKYYCLSCFTKLWDSMNDDDDDED